MTEDTEITLERPPVVVIRNAKPRDLPELNAMIAALAAHHGDAAAITPDKLERDLFGPLPWITALVADSGEDGLIGYAILVPLYRARKASAAWTCTTSSCATANAAMASAIISWPAPARSPASPAATSSRSAPRPAISPPIASMKTSTSCRVPSRHALYAGFELSGPIDSSDERQIWRTKVL